MVQHLLPSDLRIAATWEQPANAARKLGLRFRRDKGTVAVTNNDSNTTVATLRAMVRQFVDERDWERFHAPKNVSMAMAIEVAELMEHFQWITADQSRSLSEDAEKRQAVSEELADVVCYALALANTLDIDLTQSMQLKMEKNRAKYPVEQYRGTFDGNAVRKDS